MPVSCTVPLSSGRQSERAGVLRAAACGWRRRDRSESTSWDRLNETLALWRSWQGLLVLPTFSSSGISSLQLLRQQYSACRRVRDRARLRPAPCACLSLLLDNSCCCCGRPTWRSDDMTSRAPVLKCWKLFSLPFANPPFPSAWTVGNHKHRAQHSFNLTVSTNTSY